MRTSISCLLYESANAGSTIPAGNRLEMIRHRRKKDDSTEFGLRSLEDSSRASGRHCATTRRESIWCARTHSLRKQLLADHDLTFDPAMHDEGYVIAPHGRESLAVIAETPAGIFYGVQTVKQLIRGSGKDAVLLAPTVRDWPAMAHRGLSDDWSRGPLPNMDFLKREIRTLAAYKYNIFSPYFEHTFAYTSHAGGGVSRRSDDAG